MRGRIWQGENLRKSQGNKWHSKFKCSKTRETDGERCFYHNRTVFKTEKRVGREVGVDDYFKRGGGLKIMQTSAKTIYIVNFIESGQWQRVQIPGECYGEGELMRGILKKKMANVLYNITKRICTKSFIQNWKAFKSEYVGEGGDFKIHVTRFAKTAWLMGRIATLLAGVQVFGRTELLPQSLNKHKKLTSVSC